MKLSVPYSKHKVLAKVIEGEMNGKPSQDLSICKLSFVLVLSPVNFALAKNVLAYS